jgi:hypothetical protein
MKLDCHRPKLDAFDLGLWKESSASATLTHAETPDRTPSRNRRLIPPTHVSDSVKFSLFGDISCMAPSQHANDSSPQDPSSTKLKPIQQVPAAKLSCSHFPHAPRQAPICCSRHATSAATQNSISHSANARPPLPQSWTFAGEQARTRSAATARTGSFRPPTRSATPAGF